MLGIYILGMKEGTYPIEVQSKVQDLPNIFPEFIGIIAFRGKLIKLGNRFEVIGKLECKSELECDISLEKYEEDISTDFAITAMYKGLDDQEDIDEDILYLKEEDKYLDISVPAAESISLALPMKRVAPKYRNKDFKEIYPEYAADLNSNKKNTWDALKNIHLN